MLVPGSAVSPLAATRILAGPVALAGPAPVLQGEAGAAAPVNADLADEQLHNLGTAAPVIKIVVHATYFQKVTNIGNIFVGMLISGHSFVLPDGRLEYDANVWIELENFTCINFFLTLQQQI